jgi:uncharacterized protein (TIGR03382 family)
MDAGTTTTAPLLIVASVWLLRRREFVHQGEESARGATALQRRASSG